MFTAVAHGRPWVDQQRLGQVVGYRLGGYRLLIAFTGGCVAVTFALLFRLARRVGTSRPIASLICGLTLAVLVSNAAARTQTFAYPLLLVLSAVYTDARERRPARLAATTLPVLELWANVHGSVLIGAAAVAGYGLLELRRAPRAHARYLAVALAGAASPLATPYGLAVVGYYRSLFGNAAVSRYVSEWQAPGFTQVAGDVFWGFLTIVVTTLVHAGRRRRRASPLGLLLSATCLVAAVRSERFAAWFALVAAVTLAEALRGGETATRLAWRARFVIGLVALELTGVTAALLATVGTTGLLPIPRVGVAGAYQALRSAPGSCLTADPTTATELLWFYQPTHGRVAFDIRYEAFPPAELTRYFRFLVNPPREPSSPDKCSMVAVGRRFQPTLWLRLRTDGRVRTLASDGGQLVVRLPAGG